MKLEIPAELHSAMVEHCRQGLPNEACGFLGGRQGKVERLLPLDNAARSPVYYRPDDKQMLAAFDALDESELQLVAIFHSHVASPALPSPTDIREAHYPDSIYIIVSLRATPPEARGFLIRKKDWRDEDGAIEEVDLVVS